MNSNLCLSWLCSWYSSIYAAIDDQYFTKGCAIYPRLSNYFTWHSIPGAIESTEASLMTGCNIMISWCYTYCSWANCKDYYRGKLEDELIIHCSCTTIRVKNVSNFDILIFQSSAKLYLEVYIYVVYQWERVLRFATIGCQKETDSLHPVVN